MWDLINDILNPESDKGGLLNKEAESYREMIEGKWKSEDSKQIEADFILEFFPVKEEPVKKHPENDMIIYAANTKNKSEVPLKETNFFTTKGNNHLLKIDSKKEFGKQKLNASLICSEDPDIKNNYLLYFIELNKYYIIDNNNEIFLGNLNEKDIESFRFSLLLAKAKITLILGEGEAKRNVTAVSDNRDLEIVKTEIKKENQIIEFKFSENIKAIVYSNNIYSDFLIFEENKIVIPEKLLINKSRILIY